MNEHQLQSARRDRDQKLSALYAANGETVPVSVFDDDQGNRSGCRGMIIALIITLGATAALIISLIY